VFIHLHNGTERAPLVKQLLYKAHGTEFTNMFRSILLLLHKTF